MISITEAACAEPLPTAAEGSNGEASAVWDGILFDKFVRFRSLITVGLGSHGTRAIQRHCRSPGQHVLDLGCSFGDAALDLATTAAQVVGIDVAPRFVREARAAARSAGVRNVQYVVGDVQTAALGGPYDLALSRFGMMFFSQPVGALRNVWRSLRSEGTLCMVVWRKREDNPVVHTAEQIARRIVPEVTHSEEPHLWTGTLLDGECGRHQ